MSDTDHETDDTDADDEYEYVCSECEAHVPAGKIGEHRRDRHKWGGVTFTREDYADAGGI